MARLLELSPPISVWSLVPAFGHPYHIRADPLERALSMAVFKRIHPTSEECGLSALYGKYRFGRLLVLGAYESMEVRTRRVC
jgi:hypothetical protein